MNCISEVERRILDYIESRREVLVERIRRLVQTPSVNPYAGDETAGNEYEAQMLFKSFLEEAGARTRLLEVPSDVYQRAGVVGPKGRSFENRPCVVGEFVFGGGSRTLILNTHIDTVGAAGMEIEPFAGEVREGAIWGRGAGDSKGNLVMGLAALEALAHSADGIHGKVVFESVVDEECNGSGAGTLACCLAGITGEAALVIDGTDLTVERGCGGVLTAEILVTGRSGHAAHPGTVNAIEKALPVVDAILEHKRVREADHPGFPLNLGVFQAGSIPAVVPGEARLGLNMSYEMAEARAAREAGKRYGAPLLMEALLEAVRKGADADPWLREHPPAVEWVKDLYPFETPADHPLVELVSRAVEDVTEKKADVSLTPAWLDAAHLAVQLGMPVVGFGCALEGQAHGPTEHLPIDQAVAGVKVLALVLYRWLSG